MSDGFTPGEKSEISRLLVAGVESPPCPRCGTPLERREIPPRPEVSYVRDRVWLLCGGCGAGTVLDRRAVERQGHRPEPGESDGRQRETPDGSSEKRSASE